MKFVFQTICVGVVVAVFQPLALAPQDEEGRQGEIYARAEGHFQNGQYAAVLNELRQLSEERRRDLPVEVCYWFGVSLYETGEWSFSQWYLLRAAAAHPSFEARFESLTRLAAIARQLGKLDRATKLLIEAVDQAPRERDFQRIVLLIGEIQQQGGAYDEATRTYDGLLRAYPELAAARLQKLWALRRAGQFEKCLSLATEMALKVPIQDRAEVSYLMAACHRALGNFPKAAELYQQLLQTFPFGPLAADARYELALCHYESGDFAKAAKLAATALRGNLSRADRLRFLWLMADAQVHQSQWQTAKDIYRQIAEGSPDRGDAAAAVGRMIEMAKRQNRLMEVEELSRLLRARYLNEQGATP